MKKLLALALLIALPALAQLSVFRTSIGPTTIVVPEPAPPAGLSAPWLQTDIGTAPVAGSASDVSGILTIKGSGDINNDVDSGHQIYQELSGDFEILTQVVSATGGSPYVKLGLSIRDDDSEEDSRYCMMNIMPNLSGGTPSFQYKAQPTDFYDEHVESGTPVTLPIWLRLVQNAGVCSGYVGATAESATTLIGSAPIAFSGTRFYGATISSGGPTEPLATGTMRLPTLTPVSSAPIPSGGVRWNPGVYGFHNKSLVKGWDYAYIASDITNEICPNSYIQGLVLHGNIGWFVNGTSASSPQYGGSDAGGWGFTAVDAALASLAACPGGAKQLVISMQHCNYGGIAPSDASPQFPSFILPLNGQSGVGSDTANVYPVIPSTQGPDIGTYGYCMDLADADNVNVIMATMQAYCTRYASNANFYGINFTYTTSYPFDAGDINTATWDAAQASVVAAERVACPTQMIRQHGDWTTPHPQGSVALLSTLDATDATLMMNDSVAAEMQWGVEVYLGLNGSPAIDYRNIDGNPFLNFWSEVETPEMCGHEGYYTPAQQYELFRNGVAGYPAVRPTHIGVVMVWPGECPAGYDWTAWKTYWSGLSNATVFDSISNTYRTPAYVKANVCPYSRGCQTGSGATNPGTLQFTTSTQTQGENVSPLVVCVSRSGGTSGAASVQLTNAGTGTAVAGTDFTNIFPVTFNWAAGNAANQCQNIVLIDRTGVQVSRTLNMAIGSVTGATVGAPSTQTATITDNDGNQIKFHPGFYAMYWPAGTGYAASWYDQPTVIAEEIDFIQDAICPHANVKGVNIFITWASLEGDTHGQYSAGIARIQSLLDVLWACSSGHKRLMLLPTVAYFQGTGSQMGPWPAYMVQTSQGGLDTSNTYGISFGVSQDVSYANIWETPTADAFIQLNQAYAAAFDTHPGFEMMTTGIESSFGMPEGTDGFTYAGIETQQNRILPAMRAAWAHTAIRQGDNFTLGDDRAVRYMQLALANKTTIGGPDTIPHEDIQANRAYVGELGGVDYRNNVVGAPNRLAFIAEVEEPETCGGKDDRPGGPGYVWPDFYNHVYSGNPGAGIADVDASYMLWQVMHSNYPCAQANIMWSGGNPSNNWADLNVGGALDFIQTNPFINSLCPSAYTNGCDTTP